LSAAFTSFVTANRISGAVTAFRVATGARNPSTPAGLSFPIAIAATGTPSGFGSDLQWSMTTPVEGAPCSTTAWTVVQGVRDLWFRAPET